MVTLRHSSLGCSRDFWSLPKIFLIDSEQASTRVHSSLTDSSEIYALQCPINTRLSYCLFDYLCYKSGPSLKIHMESLSYSYDHTFLLMHVKFAFRLICLKML